MQIEEFEKNVLSLCLEAPHHFDISLGGSMFEVGLTSLYEEKKCTVTFYHNYGRKTSVSGDATNYNELFINMLYLLKSHFNNMAD